MPDLHRSLDAALEKTRPDPCAAVTYVQTRHSPEEHCENDAVDGDEFCEQHQPYDPEDDPFVGWDPDDIVYWGD